MKAKEHVAKHLYHAYKVQQIGRGNDDHIHVSDLIDFCPRAFALCRLNNSSYHKTEHIGPGLGHTFQLGHYIQDLTATNLKNTGILYGTAKCLHCSTKERPTFFVGYIDERTKCQKCGSPAVVPCDSRLIIPITDEVSIVGHVDLLPLLEPKVAVIGENKSTKKEDFDKLSTCSTIEEALALGLQTTVLKHTKQGTLYCWMVQNHAIMMWRSKGDKVKILSDRFVLIYVTKGYHKDPFKIFECQPNKQFMLQIDAKVAEIRKYLTAKKPVLPKKICDSQFNIMARDCTARSLCFERNLKSCSI